MADFDPATGATTNPKKLTSISTEADNAQWSPDGNSDRFHFLRLSRLPGNRATTTSRTATDATPTATPLSQPAK